VALVKETVIKSRIFKYLSPADVVTEAMLVILTFIYILFNVRIDYWYVFIPLNLILIFLVWKLVNVYEKRIAENNVNEAGERSFLKILRYWYGVAAILYIFKQVYIIGFSLKPVDYDPLFIKWDYMLFGVNPTQWIHQFANPYLTEFLQLVYAYYYPMIVVFGIELYLWHRYKEFKYTIFILFFSFFFSYLLYMLFPANGPRFHLHEFYSITNELPGVFLTEPIRSFLNFGESIPPNVANPDFYVQRDAMPSLHTITAFLIMWLSWKFRSKSFYFYLPYFICMVIATVYLRYHYVVDIFGGLLVCGFTVTIGRLVYRDINKQLKEN
jgi:membrane-associated phospholipid phosphatase